MPLDWVTEQKQLAEAGPLLKLAAVLTGSTRGAAELIANAVVAEPKRVELLDGRDRCAELRVAVVRAFLASPLGRANPVTAAGGMDALAGPTRAAVALREGEALTAAETASIMDVSAPTVVAMLASVPVGRHTAELAELALLAPTVLQVVAELGTARRLVARRRRCRTGLLLAGVIVVLTAVALPTVVLPRWPVTVRETGAWHFSHEVTLQPGWELLARSVDPHSETTLLLIPWVSDDPALCRVTVRVAGDLSLDGEIKETTVEGHPARIATRSGNDVDLNWEYANDAWASVGCDPAAAVDDDLRLSIATAVRFRDHRLLLPFSLTALPTGYEISSVTEVLETRFGLPAGLTLELGPVERTTEAVSMVIGSADPAGDPPVLDCLTAPVRAVCITGSQLLEDRQNLPLIRRAVASTKPLVTLAPPYPTDSCETGKPV